MASALLQLHRFEEALQKAKRALRLDEKNLFAAKVLIECLVRLDCLEEARAALQRLPISASLDSDVARFKKTLGL